MIHRTRNSKAIAATAAAISKARGAYLMTLALSPATAIKLDRSGISEVQIELLEALATAKGWAFISDHRRAISADNPHVSPLMERKWVEANEAVLKDVRNEARLYRLTEAGDAALAWALRWGARRQKSGQVEHRVFMYDGPEESSHWIRITE